MYTEQSYTHLYHIYATAAAAGLKQCIKYEATRFIYFYLSFFCLSSELCLGLRLKDLILFLSTLPLEKLVYDYHITLGVKSYCKVDSISIKLLKLIV